MFQMIIITGTSITLIFLEKRFPSRVENTMSLADVGTAVVALFYVFRRIIS